MQAACATPQKNKVTVKLLSGDVYEIELHSDDRFHGLLIEHWLEKHAFENGVWIPRVSVLQEDGMWLACIEDLIYSPYVSVAGVFSRYTLSVFYPYCSTKEYTLVWVNVSRTSDQEVILYYVTSSGKMFDCTRRRADIHTLVEKSSELAPITQERIRCFVNDRIL